MSTDPNRWLDSNVGTLALHSYCDGRAKDQAKQKENITVAAASAAYVAAMQQSNGNRARMLGATIAYGIARAGALAVRLLEERNADRTFDGAVQRTLEDCWRRQ